MTASLEIVSRSPEETQDIGRLLGASAAPGDVFLLTGPLGAGKTCLTQGIAWGLGVKEHARSPTFVLIARYSGRLTIHHVDLFRIEDAAQALDLGLEDCLNDEDVCIVEWADRATEAFPRQSLRIDMEHGQEGQTRRMKLSAGGGRHARLLSDLAARRKGA